MNRSIGAAALILAALCAWMLSGVFKPDEIETGGAADALAAKQPTKVQVMRTQAMPVQRLVRVQGQIAANRIVNLKAEVEGRVAALPLVEGQPAAVGDVVVQLAEDYRPAQVAEAKARLKQRRSDLAASEKLRQRGLGAENDLIAAQAEVSAAEAALAVAEYQLEHTGITAPFDGVLNRLLVEKGDFVEKGQVVAEVVDNHTLIVSGQVPQHSVVTLKAGQPILVQLAEALAGESHSMTGHLKFISATADQVTRSYYVEASLSNPGLRRLIGLSATLLLPTDELRGHWVPSSALGLDSDGDLQLKLVQPDNTVAVTPIEMIRTGQDGFWVKGLPEQAQVIIVGQDFVAKGEVVEPVLTDVDIPDDVFTLATYDEVPGQQETVNLFSQTALRSRATATSNQASAISSGADGGGHDGHHNGSYCDDAEPCSPENGRSLPAAADSK